MTVSETAWKGKVVVGLVGVKFTTKVQLAFAATVWPAQLSEVLVKQSNGEPPPHSESRPHRSHRRSDQLGWD